MRRLAGIVVLLAIVAGPIPAGDGPSPTLVARTAVLSDQDRTELRSALKYARPSAKPEFPRAAMTIEQARHYADVPAFMTWQAEFGEWFVFSRPGFQGGPDSWSGIYFVRKGSNVVGFFQEAY